MQAKLRALTDAIDQDDDSALIIAARKGSASAVRALIQRYNRRLYRTARSILHDDGEAEDVVQTTYTHAFTRLDTFRGDANFSTWLMRIAINEALGRKRRRRVTIGVNAIDMERGGARLIMFPTSLSAPNPDTESARREIRDLLERAFNRLPEPFRVVFNLREIEGLSVEETASVLSIRPETVKTRLHRARRMMRETIDERMSSAFADLFPFGGARCDGIANAVLEQLFQKGMLGLYQDGRVVRHT